MEDDIPLQIIKHASKAITVYWNMPKSWNFSTKPHRC